MTDTQYELGWYHDKVREQAAEIKRLQNTLKLHAGDCQSLNGEVSMFKERAEAAEAEIEHRMMQNVELAALVQSYKADNEQLTAAIAHMRQRAAKADELFKRLQVVLKELTS